MTAYNNFKEHIARINDLCCVINLLNWDSRTQMPPGGTVTRPFQLGTLSDTAQNLFVSDQTIQLINAAKTEMDAAGVHPDTCQYRSVLQAEEAYNLSRRVPSKVVSELARLKPVAESVWVQARKDNDFKSFAPYLETIVELCRNTAESIGYSDHPYDALLLRYEPGMTSAKLKQLFADLKQGIVPIMEKAARSQQVTPEFLKRQYPVEKQAEFAMSIAQQFGYDLSRGRLDVTTHPFEISFTRQDVRISTRYDAHYLPMALFGILHESGHALYEQGVDPRLTRTVHTTDLLDLYATGGASYAVHESQSRLWENMIARSRPFWKHHFPQLQAVFPGQLGDTDAEGFYRSVNRIHPSLIRVEADEVSYNFHIMMRVEIEMGLISGEIKVRELPDIWNAKMQEYLGITPPNDSLGVLQDIHWSGGQIGTFANYTIGNMMGAQYFQAAHAQVPGLAASLARGEYAPLLNWLTENIYRHGRAYSPGELLLNATGQELSAAPFIAYLNNKYGELYP